MAISTNIEYITAKLARFGLTSDDIEMIILDNADLSLDTISLNVSLCKLAIYNSFSSILPMQDVTEGGYSVRWNLEAVKLFYKTLCNEIGKPNVLKPLVKNRSNLW